MTIEELYNWAKENNALDYDLSVNVEFGFGMIDIRDLKIIKDDKEVMVTDDNYSLDDLDDFDDLDDLGYFDE